MCPRASRLECRVGSPELKRVLGPGCGTWTFLCREIGMQYYSDNKVRLIGRERPCSGVLPVQGELGAGRTPGSHQSLDVWAEDGCVCWRPRRASCSIPSVPSLSRQDKTKATLPVGIQCIKGVWVKSTLITTRIREASPPPPPAPILVPWFSVRCQELFITYRNRTQAAKEAGASALRQAVWLVSKC